MAERRVVDVDRIETFGLIPPCVDPRFDHRTCDYWEDADRGSKLARPSWLSGGARQAPAAPPSVAENPFAPPTRDASENPFLPASRGGTVPTSAFGLGAFEEPDEADVDFNPFKPAPRRERPLSDGVPRKLALLDRGRGIFGSYAKVALLED